MVERKIKNWREARETVERIEKTLEEIDIIEKRIKRREEIRKAKYSTSRRKQR